MKKCRKTYVAPGLLDLRMVLPAGKAWITVDFTGGRSSGYGTRWARFATDDAAVQGLLERSAEFASGKITLLDS